MKIKVLPVEFWMKMLEDEDTHENEIPPVFNRDGYYFDRLNNKVWFEFGGRAFIGHETPEGFKYSLMLLNHRPLRDVQVKAIETLFASGIRNKQLQHLLWDDRSWKQIKETGRTARMFVNKFFKEKL